MGIGSKDPGEGGEGLPSSTPSVALWRRGLGALFITTAVLGGLALGWPALEGRERAFEGSWNVRVPSALELGQAVVLLLLLGRLVRGDLSATFRVLGRRFLEAPWGLRLPVLLVFACLFLLAGDWVLVLESATARLRSKEALITTEASLSADALVTALVTEPWGPPPVVRILDDDPRGHFASYYAYPRLFRMAPEERRWAAHARPNRHWETHSPDPLFQHPTRRPGAEISRSLADGLGTDFIEVLGPLRTPPEVHWLRHHELRALEGPPPAAPSYVEVGAALGWLDMESPSRLAWRGNLDDPGLTRPGLAWIRGARGESWAVDSAGAVRRSGVLDPEASPGQDRFSGRILQRLEAGFVLGSLRDGAEVDLESISLVDLDLDGRVDLFVPTPGDRPCLAYLQRPGGDFVESASRLGLDLRWDGTDSTAADFGGDGRVDILVLGPEGARLLEGLAGGGFRNVGLESPLAEAPGLGRVYAKDLDNDGDPDLYLTRSPSEVLQASNRLLINDGAGGFTESTWESFGQAQGLGWHSTVAFADFNGDGYLDLALPSSEMPFRLSAPLLLQHHGGEFQSIDVRPDWDHVASGSGRGDDPIRLRAGTLRMVTSEGRHVLATLEAPHRSGLEPGGGPIGVGTGDVRSAMFRGPMGSTERVQTIPLGSSWTPRLDLGIERRIQTHPAALLRPGGTQGLGALESRIESLVSIDTLSEKELEAAQGARRLDLDARIDELLAEALAQRFLETTAIPVASWHGRGAQDIPWVVPERFMVELVMLRPRGADDVSMQGAFAAELRGALEEGGYGDSRRGLQALLEDLNVDPILPDGLKVSTHRGSMPGAAVPVSEPRWEGWRELRWQSAGRAIPGTEAYVEELLGSKVGTVLGPFPVAAVRESGEGGGGWLGILKLHAHQEAGRAPDAWFRGTWLANERIRRARERLDELTAGALSSTEDLGVRRVTGGLRYPIGPMAEAARQSGIEDDPYVRLAIARIHREVRLEACLDIHFSRFEVGREKVASWASERPAMRTNSPFLGVRWQFFSTRGEAEESRGASRGTVPNLDGALGPEFAGSLGAAEWARIFGDDPAMDFADWEVGVRSPVMGMGEGYAYFEVTSEASVGDPEGNEIPMSWARDELRRLEEDRALSALLDGELPR